MIDFELIGQTIETTVGENPFLLPVMGLLFSVTSVLAAYVFWGMWSLGKMAWRQLWFVLFLGTFSLVLLGFKDFIFKPETETKPTAVAMAASQGSYDQVIEAVTDDYDVKVASPSDCGAEPAEIPKEVTVGFWTGNTDEEIQEHYNRIQFLEEVVSQDSTSNPQLLLTTPDDTVITCYVVRYDQSTGTATLLAGSGNVDAPAPQSLKKD